MSDVTYIPNPGLQIEWEHSVDAWAAMERVGSEIAERAASRAPHDTGRLAASIQARPAAGPRGGAGVEVVADVEYAKFVEYGTSEMAAEPFLRPALDEVVS